MSPQKKSIDGMKIRRSAYLAIGVFLIILNILINITNPYDMLYGPGGDSFNPGYFLGSNFFVIFGLVLLRLAYKVQQKIKTAIQMKEMEDAIREIGKKV
ncbi:MAG: hypothetical protein KIT80_17830 [Chitinophagaceae bacterium]|nr:hypothetical protein [Chitinophagaceae bacterium]MCW5928785.1 hypothetical protein [Chitinophagaceae bacterium]